MQLNPILSLIRNKLKDTYHIDVADENAIRISSDQLSTPFLICVIEDDPSVVLLSFTVEFTDASKIADILITITHITNVQISEPFYIDQIGNMHWGIPAYENFNLNLQLDLNEIEPNNDTKH